MPHQPSCLREAFLLFQLNTINRLVIRMAFSEGYTENNANTWTDQDIAVLFL